MRENLIGLALGLFGSAFNLWVWFLIAGALGRLMAADSADELISTKKAKMATVLVLCAFFVKLPIFIALAIYTRGLGGHALTCFLIGLALVYSALIWWTLARR